MGRPARLDVQALFAAARAQVGGEPQESVADRTGLSREAISAAVMLIRHAPTTARRVLAGEVEFSRAVQAVRARRADERRRAGKRVVR